MAGWGCGELSGDVKGAVSRFCEDGLGVRPRDCRMSCQFGDPDSVEDCIPGQALSVAIVLIGSAMEEEFLLGRIVSV